MELLGHVTELLRGALGSPWLWVLVFAVSGLDALLPFMPSETTVVTVAVLLGPDPAQLTLLAVVAPGARGRVTASGTPSGGPPGRRPSRGCSADPTDAVATNGHVTRCVTTAAC